MALLTVIGITVAITLSAGGRGSGDDPTTGPPNVGGGSSSEIASANDNGPANVITADPTCASTRPILDTLAAQSANGWDKRDPSIAASEWTPSVRSQYLLVEQATRNAADQMVALAKLTPHRVMRELYEQFIAYSRAYADRIPTYNPRDDTLAIVSVTTGNTIGDVCAAIDYGSAAARGPMTAQPAPLSGEAPAGNVEEPQLFLAEPNAVCSEWKAALSQYQDDTVAWVATDPDVPASQWSLEQQAINVAVAPVMSAFADKLEALGENSGNPTLRDFATLSAQYRRAYVQALASYIPADKYLANASLKLSGVILAACQAT